MTRDDIIRMTREVGLWPAVTDMFPKELERFAALVAAAEREACAKVCEDKVTEHEFHSNFVCAAAIRARGQE